MNKLIAIVISLVFVGSVYGVQDMTQTAPPTQESAIMSDMQLVKDVRDHLSKGDFAKSFDLVVIESKNGTLMLTGFVGSEEDRTKVEKAAKEVKGVIAVDNKLVITNLKAMNADGSDDGDTGSPPDNGE